MRSVTQNHPPSCVLARLPIHKVMHRMRGLSPSRYHNELELTTIELTSLRFERRVHVPQSMTI